MLQQSRFEKAHGQANVLVRGQPVEDRRHQGEEQDWDRIKSRVAGGLLASMVLILAVVSNLPYRYVESAGEVIGYLELAEGTSYRIHQAPPVMAGWPLRYWIQYSADGQPQDRLWEPFKLWINLGVGILAALGIYGFFQARSWNKGGAPDQTESPRRRRLLDTALALAILAVPALIFGRDYQTSSHHRQLAHRLAPIAICSVSCMLPKPLDDHLPTTIKRNLVRLRQVHVYGARDRTLEEIASLPTLASLHCYAGDFSEKPLHKLLENPHFCSIQFSRRVVSDAEVEFMSRLPWLRQLRLSNTTLTGKQLRKCDQLALKVVDLAFTNVSLSEIGKPGWSASVESLHLSRPADGVEATLTIDGWPLLKDVLIHRRSQVLNDAVLGVHLVDLPRLERISIDRVQKHDLTIRNAPRLSRIDEAVADLRFVFSNDSLFPGLMWVRSLELSGVDSLTSLGCFARDLEHFHIDPSTALRSIELGSFLASLLGEIRPQPADPDRCRVLIQQFGKLDGPSELNLRYLPLEGLDLSPLAENPRIRHLRIEEAGISFAQVQQLEGMGQLETLAIRSTPLYDDQLSWILSQFPNLQNLTIDSTALSKLDLNGYKNLRDLRLTPMEHVDEVRVVDLPYLKTSLRIRRSPQVMEIGQVPGLRGLAVECPWPANARLDGLRDLESFFGGGTEINDQVFSEILRCHSLDRLTLAYTSVSAEMLRRIGDLKALSFLALPGAPLTDEIVRDWGRLASLWEINLDDTQISEETLAWLSRIESLRRLSINRVPLSDPAIDILSQLHQVSELHLAGLTLSRDQLKNVLNLSSIETLELSGCELDDAQLNVLCSEGGQLRHLILHDSNVTSSDFQRLLAITPDIYVDLGMLPKSLDPALLGELHRRADLLQKEMSIGWRLMLRSRDELLLGILETTPASDASDNELSEEPVTLPPTFMSQLNRIRFTSPVPITGD